MRHTLPLRLLILDTETTGLVPRTHRVIEIACIVIEGGRTETVIDTLLAVPGEVTIPPAVQTLTHILPADLVGKPTFREILPTLAACMTPSTVIVGQNVGFDIGMLQGEGWQLDGVPWIDTSMLASLVFPELSSYSLGYVSAALSLTHTPKHRAMGDVRATTELLSHCIDRIIELPQSMRDKLDAIAACGPEGYRRFFAALPRLSAQSLSPLWLAPRSAPAPDVMPIVIDPPAHGTVRCQQESLDPFSTDAIIRGLSARQWCAVKNIRSTLRRSPAPNDCVIFDAPTSLRSKEATDAFLRHETFTAAEMTLAMKLELYDPVTERDLPLHGDERSVWAGKIACTAASPEYRALLKAASQGRAIISHQHLLALALDTENTLPDGVSVIIDDASMLEDSVTAAAAWTCHLPTMRSAAQGDHRLTQCVDLIDLWSERIRDASDLRYLTEADLADRSSRELDRTLEEVLSASMPPLMERAISDARRILDPRNLAGRIVWIEAYGDRQKTIKSVPSDISALLRESLFSRVSTTLLVPHGHSSWLAPIVHVDTVAPPSLPSPRSRLVLGRKKSIEECLGHAQGKTILLVGSKRIIEDIYVRHAQSMEDAHRTLLCQGFSGGQGRMEAEFAQAGTDAVLVLTPWMYEGMEFPAGSVHRLFVHSLPFDHPSHPIFHRRSARYQNGFMEYAVPRLCHRLFRLVRGFMRHAALDGELWILDDRLSTKAYGADIAAYVREMGGE